MVEGAPYTLPGKECQHSRTADLLVVSWQDFPQVGVVKILGTAQINK